MKKAVSVVVEFIRSTDKFIWLFCLTLSGLSILLLYSMFVTDIGSVEKSTIITQVAAIGIGIVAAIVISSIDYHALAAGWKIHLPIALILVILTLTPIGIEAPGTDNKAWLMFFGVSLQPAEILKVSFILTFAYHLNKVQGHVNELKNFLLLCLHGGAVIGLILAQGDTGTAIIFGIIFIFMLFTAGLSFKIIIPAIIATIIAIPVIWNYVLLDKHRERILIAWWPENDKLGVGNQQYIGRIVIGSGQTFGKGLFANDLTTVSAIQTDYIFAHLGQTLGYIGCIALLVVFSLLLLKIIIVSRSSRDLLGTYICVGVFAMILAQCIINIGMVLCALPVIGVTLPFLSAGGTSIVVTFMAVSLVMNVHSRRKKKLFFED